MDYSFERENFRAERNENCILSIQLSPDGFSFYIADKDSFNRPLYFFQKILDEPGLSPLMSALIDFNGFNEKNFYRTDVVFNTHEFCLIPEEMFSDESGIEFLRLSHPLPDQFKSYSSKIHGVNARVMFHVPDALKQILESGFVKFNIFHSVCPSSAFATKMKGRSCVINSFGKGITITITEENSLLFFNTFSMADENDLVYYTLNAIKNCKLRAQDVQIYLTGFDPQKNFTLFSKYISQPVVYTPELSDMPEGFPSGILFNHLEAVNCVS
jgi:hypothetical protein